MTTIYLAVLLGWSSAPVSAAPPQTSVGKRPAAEAEVQHLVDVVAALSSPQMRMTRKAEREVALELLGNPEPTARDQVKSVYLRLLGNGDDAIKTASARGLRVINATEAVPSLRDLLRKAPHFRVSKSNRGGITPDAQQLQLALTESLAHFKDTESVDEILSRDELMSIDVTAGGALAQFGAPIIPKLLAVARKGDIRKGGATTAIAAMRDEAALPQLIPLLKDSDSQVAAAASRALGEIALTTAENKRLVESALHDAAQDKNEYVRMHAYDALVRRKGENAFQITSETLRKEKGVARLHIFEAIMQSDRKEAVPALKEFIKEDEKEHPSIYDTTHRKVAAQAIYRLTGERVPYKGVEEDRKLYRDPYDPQKF